MSHPGHSQESPSVPGAGKDEQRSAVSLLAEAQGDRGSLLHRFASLCPLLAVVLSVGVLAAFGLSWRNAVLAALLLVCPALILWGVIATRRSR